MSRSGDGYATVRMTTLDGEPAMVWTVPLAMCSTGVAGCEFYFRKRYAVWLSWDDDRVRFGALSKSHVDAALLEMKTHWLRMGMTEDDKASVLAWAQYCQFTDDPAGGIADLRARMPIAPFSARVTEEVS